MQTPFRGDDNNQQSFGPDAMSRRDFLSLTAAAGALGLAGSHAVAQSQPDSPPVRGAAAGRDGLLYPQQNFIRNVLDLSGLWQFQLDPKEEGETQGWFTALPASRPIAVPCSWNDLFDDARDYLGLAWYRREAYVPSAWRGQRAYGFILRDGQPMQRTILPAVHLQPAAKSPQALRLE